MIYILKASAEHNNVIVEAEALPRVGEQIVVDARTYTVQEVKHQLMAGDQAKRIDHVTRSITVVAT